MSEVAVRLYGDLDDLVAGRARPVPVEVRRRRSVKDLVESLGVPHTEIGLLLRDEEPVGFGALVTGGERLAVFPVTAGLSMPGPELRPDPPQPLRFLLDVHLGSLARRLRILGLDARYDNDRTDSELAGDAVADGRVLLTRDRGLLMRDAVVHGQLIRSDDADDQAIEVVRRWPADLEPYTRCANCNGRLDEVEKEEVLSHLPPRTRVEHEDFSRCRRCGQVFWPGSHKERLDPFVLRASSEAALAAWRRR